MGSGACGISRAWNVWLAHRLISLTAYLFLLLFYLYFLYLFLTKFSIAFKNEINCAVVAPIPAARNKIPRPVISATTSPSVRHEGRIESVVMKNDRHERNGQRKLSSSSLSSTPSSDADDLTLDSKSMDMFSSRNELHQTTKTQRAVAVEVASVGKRREQLELQSTERAVEAMRLKLAQERQQCVKVLMELEMELEMAARIETKEQRTASPSEVEERTKRKKWDPSPQQQLEVLATARSGDSSDDDETVALAVPVSPMRRLRIPSVVASRTSSVSEFFSFSEDEDDMPIPVAAPKEFRNDDGVKNEEDLDDPDASFAAMCAALARRKQQGEPQLPNDVSLVPIETFQSLIQVDGCGSPLGVDGDASNGIGFWHRSSSEPGWITEKNHQSTSSTSARSTSPALRRSSSFNDVPGDSLLFPLLSNSSFSAVL
jgi:hypothetical protein